MLLDTVRVLDLTDHRGEVAAWLLGRLGADVVKVEPPGGTAARNQPPHFDGAPPGLRSLQFCAYNDNKASISLDLDGSAADRATLLELAAGADVVFDSGPPGWLATAGVTDAELTAANPRLVTVLIAPFGADGPRADQPWSELTLAALGGPMSLQGVRERAPLKVSIPQVWRHAGAEAAVAALVALARVDNGAGAQFVDVSAQAAMTWTMLNAMEAHEVQGFDFERAGSTVSLALPIRTRWRAADGYVIAVPISGTSRPLVPWLIEEGIVDASWLDEDWSTFDHRVLSGQAGAIDFDTVGEALTELCPRYTRHELLTRGLAEGVTIAPVHKLSDLDGLEHLEARGFWTPARLPGAAKDQRWPGMFVTLDGKRPPVHPDPPPLDRDRAALGSRARTGPRQPAAGPGAPPSAERLPLEGVKVADFSWIGVGPITAKCLADHGATVVRVESEKRLDGLRLQPPFKDAEFGTNRSNFFGTFNTSKLGLGVDLSTAGGLEVARRLCRWADVVIDSFRPGTMERLGLGHGDITRENPSVITVTTSLVGGGGPLSSMAGYGYHAAALAGFTELVGWPDLGPDGPWMAYTDTIGPRLLTAALLAALDRRRRTGEGVHIEGAQLEMALQFLAPELAELQLTGHEATRLANRDPYLAPQGVYPCAGDDEWCAITVPDDDAWKALRGVLGEPSWAADPELATVEGRQRRHDELDERLAAWTAERRAEEVEAAVCAAGVPAGKVQRSRDLLADPQHLHRRFYRRLEHSEVGEVPYAGHQYRIRGYDHGPRTAAPALGEHTIEVLTELLGMIEDEVADVAATGAIG